MTVNQSTPGVTFANSMNGDPEVLGAAARLDAIRERANQTETDASVYSADAVWSCRDDRLFLLHTLDVARESRPVGEGIVSDEDDQHDIPGPPPEPPSAEVLAKWRERGIIRAGSPGEASLDVGRLAAAINDAQIDPLEIRLGHDLTPLAERIAKAYGR